MNSQLRWIVTVACLAFLGCAGDAVFADVFGNGVNTFAIDMVPIGNPGNVADTTGNPNPVGSVAYEYRIAKYEISEEMINKANAQSALDGAPLGITQSGRGPNMPATRLSWFEAAEFINWLNTSSGNTPAYKFDPNDQGVSCVSLGVCFTVWQPGDAGYNAANPYRNSLAKYFLPSVDEWYKAAYYDPASGAYFDYPTGSNAAPTPVTSGTAAGTAVFGQLEASSPAAVTQAGGLSPYGTMGQGGNVIEMEETASGLVNSSIGFGRGMRAGMWFSGESELRSATRFGMNPYDEHFLHIGFRIASVVPEPGTLLLSLVAGLGFVWRRRAPFRACF